MAGQQEQQQLHLAGQQQQQQHLAGQQEQQHLAGQQEQQVPGPLDVDYDAVFQLGQHAPAEAGPPMPLQEDGLEGLGNGFEVLTFPWESGTELSPEITVLHGLYLAEEAS